MKLKARLFPRLDSPTKWIWEIRSLQLGKCKQEWIGRTFYSLHPPFYKLKAITNSNVKTIHFAYSDRSVPDSLKGSRETFSHESAVNIISEVKALTVWWKGVPWKLEFEKVDKEVLLRDKEGNSKRADLLCYLKEDSRFIEVCGGDKLIVEFKNTSRSSIGKKAFYRDLDICSIEINIGDSPTAKYEANLRQRRRGIPPDNMEKSYMFLGEYLSKTVHDFEILHFTSLKKQRFEEGKITLKAKAKAFKRK